MTIYNFGTMKRLILLTVLFLFPITNQVIGQANSSEQSEKSVRVTTPTADGTNILYEFLTRRRKQDLRFPPLRFLNLSDFSLPVQT